jgi:hypothetical protein
VLTNGVLLRVMGSPDADSQRLPRECLAQLSLISEQKLVLQAALITSTVPLGLSI